MDFLQLQSIFIYTFVLNSVRSEYVLVTVDVNDIKRVARYFVSEPVAEKIAEFVVTLGVKKEIVDDGDKIEPTDNFKLKNSDENDELSMSLETPKLHKDILHKSRNQGKVLNKSDNKNHKVVKKFIPDLNDDSDEVTEGYKEILVKYNEKAKKHEHDKRKYVTFRPKTSFYYRRRGPESDENGHSDNLSNSTQLPSSGISKSGDFDDFTTTKIPQKKSLD